MRGPAGQDEVGQARKAGNYGWPYFVGDNKPCFQYDFATSQSGALYDPVQIKVTNLWVNRLIGDAQPAVTSKITFTTMPFCRADSPLLPSGLLGPVRVLEATPASATVKR